MKMRSRMSGTAAITLSLALAAPAAMAQDDPADAMPESAHEFMEMMLGFAPEGMLDYESLERIGDEGFALIGVVLTPPGEEESILVNRVEVDRIDWIALMADEEPDFITARVTGIDVPAALFEEEIADIGYDFGDRVAAELAIDYERDDQAIDLRDLAIRIPEVLGLSVSLNAMGVPQAESMDDPMMAASSASLSGFTFTIEDLGGLPEIIATSAQEFGMSDEDALGLLRAQAPMAMMMLEGERGSQIAENLMAIVEDLPSLAAPIRISLSPDEPLTMADFMAAMEQDPEVVLNRMGAMLDYQ